jgi:hypothetical protein
MRNLYLVIKWRLALRKVKASDFGSPESPVSVTVV